MVSGAASRTELPCHLRGVYQYQGWSYHRVGLLPTGLPRLNDLRFTLCKLNDNNLRSVTAHLVVLLEVPVVVSHPRLAAFSSVKSERSLGIRTGDTLKQQRS